MFKDVKVLEKALDAVWLRNQVIANNISNVDTPGYKRYDVHFEEQLNSAMKRMDNRRNSTSNGYKQKTRSSVEEVEPKIIRTYGTTMRPDGNNVDIDVEMSNLAKNVVQYNALIQKLSRQFQRMKTVIQEGRR